MSLQVLRLARLFLVLAVDFLDREDIMSNGMTLRQWYVGQALSGGPTGTVKTVIENCFKLADGALEYEAKELLEYEAKERDK